MPPLYDERVYGAAPVEQTIVEGEVFLTLAGVMKMCHLRSETSVRANPGLMAIRCQLSPKKFVWPRDEVVAYVKQQRRAGRLSKSERAKELAKAARRAHIGQKARAGKRGDAALKAVMDAKMTQFYAAAQPEAS